MENKKNINVFISYSWDSQEHKQKVADFIMRLRSEGLNVIYDGDVQFGERIPFFMEDAICSSDYVLYICTPKYKEKADNRQKGVGYENNIITGELLESHDERKFIPVLFSGSWQSSNPNWGRGKLGCDLSNPSTYETQFALLVSTLKGARNISTAQADNSSNFIKSFSDLMDLDPNEIKKCLNDYKKYLKHDDDNAELYSAIGFCYLKLGTFDSAIESFETALAFVPENPDAYYYAAISMLRGKRPFLMSLSSVKKAVKYIESAIDVKPRGKYYALLAIIQYDYFEAKEFNNNHSIIEYLNLVKQNNISKKEIEEIYMYIPDSGFNLSTQISVS